MFFKLITVEGAWFGIENGFLRIGRATSFSVSRNYIYYKSRDIGVRMKLIELNGSNENAKRDKILRKNNSSGEREF